MTLRTFAVWAMVALLAVAVPAVGQTVSDDAIIDNVRIKLAGDPVVKGGALNVDSKGGVVTLSGNVDQQKQKDKATKLARKVKGVKQVVNEIVVKKFPAK